MKTLSSLFLILFFSQIAIATDPKEALSKLKEQFLLEGKPRILGAATIKGVKVPSLYFGDYKVSMNYRIVDTIKKQYGCTASIFVKNQDEFIRVSTNVLKDNGERAIAMPLARNKAYEAVIAGRTYCGVAEIFGHKYETCYEPIKVPNKIIGIYYFGCKLD